ncbi:class I SAM-dependent methyltransferase [Gorillibacterium timonense]|uniref:class I SAM-dependent methyltransferase n=1 Tax=Gorillibacterium timonense TaxID=1689269 RepID=UPI00071D452C|nr:class I SAM-dependent methyltransferase [Gorillibacterium timonense]
MAREILSNNVERFSGFSSLYGQNRPIPPTEVIRILTSYVEETPELVVDVGCGTGLSSFIWLDHAKRIIGVEPNDDMRAEALARLDEEKRTEALSFIRGYSHELDLADAEADLITCSQSFHWMNPQPTLKEFARVLRTGGVFAAYDCDWPPVLNWEVESAYLSLQEEVKRLLAAHPDPDSLAKPWDKEGHLQQIRESGLFRYSREIVFHNWEPCTAERYVNIALSQGGLQAVLRTDADALTEAVAEFRERAERAFGDEPKDVLFCYRMRIGVK